MATATQFRKEVRIPSTRAAQADEPRREGDPQTRESFWTSPRGLTVLLLASLVLKSLIFAPISIWPLSFVCLVPWLIFVGTAYRAPLVYSSSFLFGLAFFLINMRWLYPATGWGYLSLSIYQAFFFPLMACPIRHCMRRKTVPLAISIAAIWAGAEMLRTVLFSGFPWFFLSHSLFKVLTLIQISDVAGALGVSFLVAAVNGAVTDCVLTRMNWTSDDRPPSIERRALGSLAVVCLVFVVIVAYGQLQLYRGTTRPGPTVAVLQGDFVSRVEGDEADDATKLRCYLEMLEAASAEKPDLFLLPETPWQVYLNPEARSFKRDWLESFNLLQEASRRHNALVVTGSASLVRSPTDLLAKERRYNSATVFRPDGSEPGRYDKVHVVPFGEAVPFRFGRLRFLYLWMNRLMPFSGHDGEYEYSLFPGSKFEVFSFKAPSAEGREFRFGIPICYEDVMPYVSREFVSGGSNVKRADILLNISNDGWFGRGIQQAQHLAVCVFRAVENRVGIARAVNTGVSGFIEPTGRTYDLVTGDPQGRWPENAGYKVARLVTDSRYTFYSKYGDWFGWLCAGAWLLAYVDYWTWRIRGRGGTES